MIVRDIPDPAPLIDRIIRTATADDDGEVLLADFCRSVADHGIPIWRVNIATPTIDPNFRAFTVNWNRSGGSSFFAQPHGPDGDMVYLRSPVGQLAQTDSRAARWRIEDGEGCAEYLLLEELRLQGGTDYVLRLVPFVPSTALIGAAVSFATDRPGGFSGPEIDWLDRVVPAVGLAAYRITLLATFKEVLGAYLGPMSAARVVEGQVRRGESEVITAAILLTDLKGFTTATDREDPLDVVRWLDEYLDVLGSAVTAEGGEILKFTGDGFIAMYPAPAGEARAGGACDRALAGAQRALSALARLNDARRPTGAPVLEADIALHFGELVYGNVGTAHRLDFTTIGRAVNEASRIEKLCDDLDVRLIISDSFAERCSVPLRDIGTFELRGVSGPVRLWVPQG